MTEIRADYLSRDTGKLTRGEAAGDLNQMTHLIREVRRLLESNWQREQLAAASAGCAGARGKTSSQ